MAKKSKRRRYKVINIRGCNASGKSHIVRELMRYTKARPIYGAPEPGRLMGNVIGYEGDYEGTPMYFVGSYEIMSGGADHMMKHYGGLDMVCETVRRFAGKGHVIFEGFIISGLFSRFYNLSKEIGGISWCYMDTPLEVCYKRIETRNSMKTAAMGRVKKSVGIKHVKQKFEEALRTRRKFKQEREAVFMIPYRRPMPTIHKILRGD